MVRQSYVALLICGGVIVLFLSQLDRPAAQEKEIAPQPKGQAARPPVVLPGLQKDGFVQLPNQWKLYPTGSHINVGDFPVNSVVHPSGQYLAVLHAGMKEHEIVILDLNKFKQKIVSRVTIDQTFYGICFSPDGKKLYASGGEFEVVHEYDFFRGLLSNHKTIPIQGDIAGLVVGGISTDSTGRDLFVACTWGEVIVRIPTDNPENQTRIYLKPLVKKGDQFKGEPPSPPDGRKDPPKEGDPKPKDKKDKQGFEERGIGAYPYTCLAHPDGKRLFVSLWGDASVAVIDLEKNQWLTNLPTASHPTEMALSKDGNHLFVSCSNSTQVSVLDLKENKNIQTINCALHPNAPTGNTPSSLTLLPDGMLFVANSDANNLSVFNVTNPVKAEPLGFIPTGWYPTSVRYNPTDKRLYVTNGKGFSSRANYHGPNPVQPLSRNLDEYIGSLMRGTVSVIDLPTPNKLADLTRHAYACSPLRLNNAVNLDEVPADNPIPKKVGDPSPIKYVIYIVKENRTYDQIFGDMKEGKGDPNLCLFPEAITPNHHKLAREYVLLDNFYVEGEVSADGHEWSMGAYATDFVEKSWPLSYRGSPKKKFGYPAEGNFDRIARGTGGYLWDKAAEAKVTYRSYGEWIENGRMNKDGTFEPGRATVKALEGHFDPLFRGYDLDYPDVKRAERFLSEVQRFEKEGDMPRLQIVRLPNDHTAGTRIGKPTPTAMVADNDLALGLLVEGVSKTKFWKETAIFVVEDDAQNGPDHVDAHRAVALVISPYTKKKFVDSTMYSTSSMLRTMELILGLQPMSQFDAAARPMYNSFQGKPDVMEYKHEVPKTDLKALNVAGAWGAQWSEMANLEKEDAADDILFNEVIWKSVKGAHSRMPAPVRAAFFLPKKKEDDDDDDD